MSKDLFAKPISAFIWWGLPIIVGIAASLFGSPLAIIELIWMFLFVWMGAGCVLNALSCHRLHCYISGPVFLLGALVCALFATGLIALGPHALNNVVSITLVLALLSFVPEVIWRKYSD